MNGAGPDLVIARMLAAVWIAMLANDALGGPIRAGADALGILPLVYVPFLLAGLVVLLHLACRILDLRFDAGALFIFVLVGWGVSYALLLGGELPQTAFGLYTWLPLFIGILIVRFGQVDLFLRMMAPLWLIAVGGVLLSALLPLPWIGARYEIAGAELALARDWQSFGVARLPGLTRASFTAANQIVFAACLLLLQPRRPASKIAIWLVSFLAILLTTSKMPLAALCFVPALLLAHDHFGGREGSQGLARAMVAALMAIMVALPLLALAGLRPEWSDGAGFLNLASLGGRFGDMWPRAFALIDPHGPQFWLGTGFGGIGVSQSLFDPTRYSAGDNLFVFLYVSLGIGMLAFVAAFFSRAALSREGLALALLVLSLGLTANVIEAVLPCLALGIIMGKWLYGQRAAPAAEQSWIGAQGDAMADSVRLSRT
ncbi:hypothetical protein OSH11_22780 [Kaistia dalseonensis]|uniref:Uncharacterized protein n=1 Tax=Kaistia dalseonensis TaxID=410840 RepID=A0ABU0HCY3_9HYPH|nr:hypothetical protein [Kaistia dalseonensis]MCX5497541.1 hypothetical protein [Kaistia dalseonensis]MDQ0440181.1 hypothetical protein [Kaistia dalseonensis]